MTDDFPYADMVVLALIAGLILLRLRAVLGQKIGRDAPPFPGIMHGGEAPVVQATHALALEQPEAKDEDAELLAAIPDPATLEAIAALKKSDPHFTLKRFLEGAHAAFEMLFTAFLKDDRETLKMLLAPPLLTLFTAELERRKTAPTRQETTLVAVLSQSLCSATVEKNLARLRLRFVSEQVVLERDKENKIVSGDPSISEHVQDEWVFERDITSRNPNWKIIET